MEWRLNVWDSHYNGNVTTRYVCGKESIIYGKTLEFAEDIYWQISILIFTDIVMR